ncbi:unnamed protein product [Spirodela intermedia]|uniref:Uncharacterized protein n=1 Tax=Spirodela intermedia TaxID=51605 RepID=A0A7I8KGY0_SPIIN|nr:unnamed protein product [Spirodela intermedia]
MFVGWSIFIKAPS